MVPEMETELSGKGKNHIESRPEIGNEPNDIFMIPLTNQHKYSHQNNTIKHTRTVGCIHQKDPFR